MQTKQRGVLIVILAIALALAVGIIIWLNNQNQEQNNNLPPNVTKHSDWLIKSDAVNKFSFNYPKVFGANVWNPTVWPPVVTVVAKDQDPIKAGCPNYSKEESNNPSGKSGAVNSLNYTLYQSAGVGAGNLYNEFCYVYTGVDKYYVMNIEIHSHTACGESCGAYCGTPYEKECANLDRDADINQPITDVAESFRLIK